MLIITTIAVSFLSYILNGWALSILWAWFVIPVFGLPALGIVTAIGLTMVIGFLTHQIPASVENGKSAGEKIFEATSIGIIKPLFYLGIGWVVTLFL